MWQKIFPSMPLKATKWNKTLQVGITILNYVYIDYLLSKYNTIYAIKYPYNTLNCYNEWI